MTGNTSLIWTDRFALLTILYIVKILGKWLLVLQYKGATSCISAMNKEFRHLHRLVVKPRPAPN